MKTKVAFQKRIRTIIVLEVATGCQSLLKVVVVVVVVVVVFVVVVIFPRDGGTSYIPSDGI